MSTFVLLGVASLLAWFCGAPVKDAAAAILAGLRGDPGPLRKFGAAL